MVIGIGLDLVETARVERALERHGERFVRKLMDPEEARRPARRPAPSARAASRSRSRARRRRARRSGRAGAGACAGATWSSPSGPEAGIRLDGRAAEVARELGSSGRGRLRLEVRGPLAIGEFWLLS